jgi:dihydrofolate synthase/folylpolyglutamate synthase
MLYDDALSYLSQYTNYERELRYPYDGWHMNLERVTRLLFALGSPERGLPVTHIAGTKGKGSVAAMIEAILRAAGYRTGLFTSPHLLDFRERIRLNGGWVSRSAVAALVERIIPAAEDVHKEPELGPLTYFEILTAMAIAAFAEAGVDMAILETGLGGRYDATNVCDPLISILTNVSLDHTDILGDSLEAIAAEKMMIIKPGKPAVIAPQEKSVHQLFSARRREVNAPEIRVSDRYAWRMTSEDIDGQRAEIKGKRELDDVFIKLPGEPQLINAATAITALDVLTERGFNVSDDAIKAGLEALDWPARFQRIRKSPDLILDGAHNAKSAGYLRATLESLYPGRSVTAVIGLGGDKDVEGFCRDLGPALSSVVVTRSRAMKAVASDRIKKALSPFKVEFRKTGSVAEAMQISLQDARPEEVILVTGSFYVISEVLEWNHNRAANS